MPWYRKTEIETTQGWIERQQATEQPSAAGRKPPRAPKKQKAVKEKSLLQRLHS